MRDPQLAAIVQSLRHLVPSAAVSYELRSADEFHHATRFRRRRAGFGQSIRERTARFWFEFDNQVALISVVRQQADFTRSERELLKRSSTVMAGMVIGLAQFGVATPTRLAARYAFENLVVHALLRRGVVGADSWAPVAAVSLLQELSTEDYEGAPCRSGFVFTARARTYLEERSRAPYRFEAFPEPLLLGLDFFEQPLSYRFVDGGDAFYLADRTGMVSGVLRSTKPQRFSESDRARHAHLEPLLRRERQRSWVAFVGANRGVNVALSGDTNLRWSKMRWRLLDAGHIRKALEGFGFRAAAIDTLIGAVYRISDSRVGALVLVPEDPRSRPQTAGAIDDSQLGGSLLSTFQRRHIQTLESSDALIGMLTSDGLTTISKNGRILDAGEIVDLSEEAARIPDPRAKGGGRTQAGRAASLYGLVLMVSEDGPITLFRKGEVVVSLPQ